MLCFSRAHLPTMPCPPSLFFGDTSISAFYTLSLHDALPIFFVIGGFGANAEAVATVEVYDPVTDRWEVRMPLPAPTHHLAAAVAGGRLFVAGGYSGRVRWTPLAAVYEYDAARNSWAMRAPLTTPRGALALVALDGRLHAVGGSGDSATGAAEVYYP